MNHFPSTDDQALQLFLTLIFVFLSPQIDQARMISMNNYLDQVSSAWDDYDGDKLARLISFDDPHIMSPKLQVRTVLCTGLDRSIASNFLRANSVNSSIYKFKLFQVEDSTNAVERVGLDAPIDDIVIDHLRAVYEAVNRRFVDAYESQVSLGKIRTNIILMKNINSLLSLQCRTL